MSRSGSVRLRSALGSNTTSTKSEPSTSSSGDPTTMGASGYPFSETGGSGKGTSRSSNRRTLNNNNNNNNNLIHSSNNNSNGSNGPSVLVNGIASISSGDSGGSQTHNNTNHSTSALTSTRSQSTRSSAKDKVLPHPTTSSIPSSCPMEIDEDEVIDSGSSSVPQHQSSTAGTESSTGSSGDSKHPVVPSSTALTVTDSDPNNSTNQNPSSSFDSNLLDAVSAAMEVDSSSSSSSSESSDSSDSEDSSEMDDDNCERQKVECQEDQNDLEKQFIYCKEFLYKERLHSVETKLDEVRSGRSKEYLGPLEKLQENMRTRMEICSKTREFRLLNWKHKVDAAELGFVQNYENLQTILQDSIRSDLGDKIRRLEEDRNNDFTSELWLDAAMKRKNKKSVDIFGEKKKKPVVVSGPYVVYMLQDLDIMEDLSVIKKALSAPKRKYVDPAVF